MDLHQQSKLLATEAKANLTADLFEPSRFDPAKHFPLQPPVLEHREKHPGIKSLSDFSFTGPNQSNTLQYQHGLTMATSLMLRVARGTSATVRVDGSVPVVPSPFAYQRLQANKRTACLCCIFEFGLHPASCLSDAFLGCKHPLSTTTKHIDSPFSPKIARIHSSYILWIPMSCWPSVRIHWLCRVLLYLIPQSRIQESINRNVTCHTSSKGIHLFFSCLEKPKLKKQMDLSLDLLIHLFKKIKGSSQRPRPFFGRFAHVRLLNQGGIPNHYVYLTNYCTSCKENGFRDYSVGCGYYRHLLPSLSSIQNVC